MSFPNVKLKQKKLQTMRAIVYCGTGDGCTGQVSRWLTYEGRCLERMQSLLRGNKRQDCQRTETKFRSIPERRQLQSTRRLAALTVLTQWSRTCKASEWRWLWEQKDLRGAKSELRLHLNGQSQAKS